MNRYGLTEREKAIWPPKKPAVSEDLWITVALGVLVLVLAATIVHFTIEPNQLPIVRHPQVSLSDREQERLYCSQWATSQQEVKGGTSTEIRDHCAKYL
jgi:hypothetical protein